MSHDAALKFLNMVSSDEQLKDALSSASSAEVLEISKSKGCDMSMQEFKTALTSAVDAQTDRSIDELSDEILESVAGGVPLPIGLIGVGLCALAVYKMGVRRDWWDSISFS